MEGHLMDNTNIHPSDFASGSYRYSHRTKCPDDIYVSQTLINFRDSNCTHFEQKSTQSEEKAQEYQEKKRERRRYLKWTHVEGAAANKYRNYGEGITYEDVIKMFPGVIKTKGQAQDLLRNHKSDGKLYTYHRTKPQQYFLSNEQAKLAALNYMKSTHSYPIGVERGNSSRIFNRPKTPLNNILQHLKAQDFYHALLLTEIAPLGIHNIRLDLSLAKPDYYHRILSAPDEKEKGAKKLEHRTGDIHVLYKSFPCGTVDISIACSKHSFRLETEWDVTELFAFVGGVRHTLTCWLRDVNDVIVPPLEYWRLVHADLSKDVKVPQKLHITVPNMELKIAERVFRLYVKTIGHESLLRLEEFRMFNTAFEKGIKSIVESRSNLSLDPCSLLEFAKLKQNIASLTTQLAQKDEIISGLAVQIQELRSAFKGNNGNNIVQPKANNSSKGGEDSHASLDMISPPQQCKLKEETPQFSLMAQDVVELVSADSIYEKEKCKPRISTGSKSLDGILGGGIETGVVTEFYGKAGSCKSELCFTAAVTAQQGLVSQEERAGKVLFIDAKNTVAGERIYQIAGSRGLNPQSVLKNIQLMKSKSAKHLQQLVQNWLPGFLENHDVCLLIVDSIISSHHGEFKGRENQPERQQSLNIIMQSLKMIACKFNIAVIVTNQIVGEPECLFADTATKATGDYSVANASTHRIMFELAGNNRIARMVDSPCYPVREVLFTIDHQGIADVPMNE
jgi:DNA repair protein RadA